MTFNFLRPGLTVNVEAKVQEQIILDSSDSNMVLILTRNKAIYVFYICVSGKFFRKYKHCFQTYSNKSRLILVFNEKIFERTVAG